MLPFYIGYSPVLYYYFVSHNLVVCRGDAADGTGRSINNFQWDVVGHTKLSCDRPINKILETSIDVVRMNSFL